MPDALDLLRHALKSADVPDATAEAAINKFADALEHHQNERQANADERQASAELELAAKWGTNTNRNLAIAQQAVDKLGLDAETVSAFEAALEKGTGASSAVRLIEAFYDIGQKIAAASPPPATAERSEQMPPAAAGDAATIKSQLNALESDPQFLQIFNDERHLRHQEMVDKRRQLISQLAEAQPAAPRTTVQVRRETELDRIEKDPEFMKVLNNPRHPKHAEFAARRHQIIEKEAGGPSRNVGAQIAELDRLEKDPEFRKAIGDQRHPQYAELTTRRTALIEQVAAE